MKIPAAQRLARNQAIKAATVLLTTTSLSVILTMMLSSIMDMVTLRWIGLGLAILASLITLLIVFRGLKAIYRIRYIAFVSSGTNGVTFYQRLFELIQQEAADHSMGGKFQYVVFPWVSREGKARRMIKSLRNINHSGIIFIPSSETEFRDDLDGHGVPIVLLDAVPSNTASIQRGVHFVSGDEVTGGRLAASVACQKLREKGFGTTRGDQSPLIWMLVGPDFHFIRKQRHEIFEECVREQFPGAVIQSSEQMGYQQSTARRHIYDSFVLLTRADDTTGKNRADAGAKIRMPDIIFCANDDMALGAREALRQLEEESQLIGSFDWSRENLPQIIGYGGTPEVKDLLRTDFERFLLATVDVKLESLAKNAWHTLLCDLEGLQENKDGDEVEIVVRNWAAYERYHELN